MFSKLEYGKVRAIAQRPGESTVGIQHLASARETLGARAAAVMNGGSGNTIDTARINTPTALDRGMYKLGKLTKGVSDVTSRARLACARALGYQVN